MVYPVYSWLDGSKVKNDHNGMKRSPNLYDDAKTYKDSFNVRSTQHKPFVLKTCFHAVADLFILFILRIS